MGALHDISAKSSSPSKFRTRKNTKLISYAGNVLLTILKGKLELYRETKTLTQKKSYTFAAK